MSVVAVADGLTSHRERAKRIKIARYQAVWDVLAQRNRGRPKMGDVDKLIDRACVLRKISRRELSSKTRRLNVSIPRQAIFVIIRKRWPRYSFPEIGRRFDLSHAAVLHAWQKYQENDNPKIRRIPKNSIQAFQAYVHELEIDLYGRRLQ
jgi:chromosomal replication initiation ATPase DnaA